MCGRSAHGGVSVSLADAARPSLSDCGTACQKNNWSSHRDECKRNAKIRQELSGFSSLSSLLARARKFDLHLCETFSRWVDHAYRLDSPTPLYHTHVFFAIFDFDPTCEGSIGQQFGCSGGGGFDA